MHPPTNPARHFARLTSHRNSKRVLIATGISLFLLLSFFWYTRFPEHGPGYPPHFDDIEFDDTDFEPSLPNKTLSKWESRQNEVRNAFVHAYSGYRRHAFPADELLPLSGSAIDKFNGWSVTMLDSLDTMWMMGLQTEFADATQVVAAHNFSTPLTYNVPFFETVIRYLGGLLSAYAFSKDPIFLTRADDLGSILLPAFNTPSGFPGFAVNRYSGEVGTGWTGSSVLFAEVASCQLEFKYLAKLTGRSEYYTAAERVMEVLYAADPEEGLFASYWTKTGQPSNHHYSVGASADSGYEYFLKQYLLSGDTKALQQYLKSIEGIIKWLLYVSPTRDLLYVGSMNDRTFDHGVEHLACFLPGLLALGAHTIPDAYLSSENRQRHKWAAEGLAYTCYLSYADQLSGLGPDTFHMQKGTNWLEKLMEWETTDRVGKPPGLKEEGPKLNATERDYTQGFSSSYLLRPETVESLYVLWKTTGDEKWRERGYEIFSAIEKHAKTEYGYASINYVDSEQAGPIDDMPSFFLAETLKYLFLLFDEGDPYPLSKWVLNTEAHPLPVFEWSPWERTRYNITT